MKTMGGALCFPNELASMLLHVVESSKHGRYVECSPFGTHFEPNLQAEAVPLYNNQTATRRLQVDVPHVSSHGVAPLATPLATTPLTTPLATPLATRDHLEMTPVVPPLAPVQAEPAAAVANFSGDHL